MEAIGVGWRPGGHWRPRGHGAGCAALAQSEIAGNSRSQLACLPTSSQPLVVAAVMASPQPRGQVKPTATEPP